MHQLILALKTILITVTLLAASYQDIKTREIEDKIWLISGVIGALLTTYEILTTPDYPLMVVGLSIGLTSILAFGIFYFGLYGGADAKALVAIAVTMPLAPTSLNLFSPIFPLTILGNSLIISLILIPACLVANLIWYFSGATLFEGITATKIQKVGAVFTGLKVKPATAKSVHFNLMEKIAGNGGHYLRLFSRITEEDEIKRIDENRPNVWVTPAIPMIVFFLIGFLSSFAAGDFIFRILIYFLALA